MARKSPPMPRMSRSWSAYGERTRARAFFWTEMPSTAEAARPPPSSASWLRSPRFAVCSAVGLPSLTMADWLDVQLVEAAHLHVELHRALAHAVGDGEPAEHRGDAEDHAERLQDRAREVLAHLDPGVAEAFAEGAVEVHGSVAIGPPHLGPLSRREGEPDLRRLGRLRQFGSGRRGSRPGAAPWRRSRGRA